MFDLNVRSVARSKNRGRHTCHPLILTWECGCKAKYIRPAKTEHWMLMDMDRLCRHDDHYFAVKEGRAAQVVVLDAIVKEGRARAAAFRNTPCLT